tara:strand:+ start:418 stop:588 length:171 start_codon:yes stop_codon:yes gene_type:complete
MEVKYTVKTEDVLHFFWIYDENDVLVGHGLKEEFCKFIKGAAHYDYESLPAVQPQT